MTPAEVEARIHPELRQAEEHVRELYSEIAYLAVLVRNGGSGDIHEQIADLLVCGHKIGLRLSEIDCVLAAAANGKEMVQ